MACDDFELIAVDNTGLKGTLWHTERCKTLLVWVHGYGEHRKRYTSFANWLNRKNVALVIVDLRGHGESGGKRGAIRKFEQYLNDTHTLLQWVANEHSQKKLFLGSHSLGGLIVARYLQSYTLVNKINALIFSSPNIAMSIPPAYWKQGLTSRLSLFKPGFQLASGIKADKLSRDPAITNEFKNDTNCFTKASARWLYEIQQNQQLVIARSSEINLPCLVMQGSDDAIVDPRASRSLFDGIISKKKNWMEFHGYYHELLNDTGHEKVFQNIWAFIRKYK